MAKITASEKMDALDADDLPRWLTNFLREVKNILNGKINFRDNFDGQIVSVEFEAADTDTLVSTRLRRTPTSYIILGKSANMVIYDGDTDSSTGNIYLKASAIGTAKLLIF